MKKFLCGLIICLFLILLPGCLKKTNGYTIISYEQYLEKINAAETFPLVIGSESCSACATYKNTMDVFMKKYKVEVFYIDLEKLSDEQYLDFKTAISFSGTPTTVFIENGKLTSFYNRISSAKELSVVEDYFRINGYIK